jgi:hypothetical protein
MTLNITSIANECPCDLDMYTTACGCFSCRPTQRMPAAAAITFESIAQDESNGNMTALIDALEAL